MDLLDFLLANLYISLLKSKKLNKVHGSLLDTDVTREAPVTSNFPDRFTSLVFYKSVLNTSPSYFPFCSNLDDIHGRKCLRDNTFNR